MKNKLLSVLTAGAFIASAVSFSTASLAAGKKVDLSIASVGESMVFNKKTLSAPSDSIVTLSMKNTSASMLHNWVLTKKGTTDQVANEGIGMGESKSYVNKNNKNVLAFTKIVKPGKTEKVTFKAPAKGTYDYVCTSPGHAVLMKGTFTVK